VTAGDGEIDEDIEEELEEEIEEERVMMMSCLAAEEAMVSDIVEDFDVLLVELVESMIWVQLGVDVLARFVGWSRRELRSGTSVVK